MVLRCHPGAGEHPGEGLDLGGGGDRVAVGLLDADDFAGGGEAAGARNREGPLTPVLAFVACRLEAESVGLVFGARMLDR